MNNILKSSGFTLMHSCGCGGGESTWRIQGKNNVIRIRNTSTTIEVREKNRNGKVIKTFQNINDAISFVKEN